jgi:hypothetical protein
MGTMFWSLISFRFDGYPEDWGSVCFSATLIPIYQITRCHVSEDHIMNFRRHGSLKSMKSLLLTEQYVIKADDVLLVREVKKIISVSEELNNIFPYLNSIVLFN